MTEQQPTTKLHTNYPPMPEPKHSRVVDGLPCITVYEHQNLMRAYVDADRAMRAHAAPDAVAGTSERWRERWHGSPTEQGWSIMHGRECIAYLGPDVSSEAVSAIVAAHNAAPTTQAAPAAHGDALSWLQANDMAALERFAETTDDDESYDIGKDAVQRLAGFGCLRSHGFGKYSITDFGHYVLNDWSLARELPFKSQSERDAACNR